MLASLPNEDFDPSRIEYLCLDYRTHFFRHRLPGIFFFNSKIFLLIRDAIDFLGHYVLPFPFFWHCNSFCLLWESDFHLFITATFSLGQRAALGQSARQIAYHNEANNDRAITTFVRQFNDTFGVIAAVDRVRDIGRKRNLRTTLSIASCNRGGKVIIIVSETMCTMHFLCMFFLSFMLALANSHFSYFRTQLCLLSPTTNPY